VREGEVPRANGDAAEQRRLVDAFFAAARAGDIDGLVAVLDPEVVLRADAGDSPHSVVIRGAHAVAGRATMFAASERTIVAADVNGTPGVVVNRGELVLSVMEFTVVDGRIAAIHALADPDRLARLPIPSE
jgi:RNA polymerase sigma-70 factor (ECF subfamily)